MTVIPSTDPTALRGELKSILLRKSVIIGEEDQFTLASGAKSNFYVDCRLTTFDARGARLAGMLAWKLILDSGVEARGVGGLTMGADPLALAIAIASDLSEGGRPPPLNAFAIRKEAKKHGRGRRIEGNFEQGMPVVVVDDVITTGGSTIQAIDAIEEAGGKVVLALVLVDRQEGGREAIEARVPKVEALFTKKDLMPSG